MWASRDPGLKPGAIKDRPVPGRGQSIRRVDSKRIARRMMTVSISRVDGTFFLTRYIYLKLLVYGLYFHNEKSLYGVQKIVASTTQRI